MSDVVTVEMPALPQNTLAVRLLAAGLANLHHFNSEEIEDVKLSVCEACFCAPHGNHKLRLSFILEENKMMVEIEAVRHARKTMLGLGDATEEGIGFLLMRNLMDSMEFKSGEAGTFIRLVKEHKSSKETRSGLK